MLLAGGSYESGRVQCGCSRTQWFCGDTATRSLWLSWAVSINIIMTCIAAYVLSRHEFMWRRFLTAMIVITMYFSGGLIPFYFTVKELGLNALGADYPGGHQSV